eukprot:CAMPEP_0117541044 /NCGR_PEP_ID=MMETSP0784-20121206/43815_1 /TAXON_ID=39447 /ORGANISM="" /LENGTH=474 /DNA_ID=CAMNT_0005337725 /DNA_START=44 /DNA_END=1470 /DNA_ORIENTATION=+
MSTALSARAAVRTFLVSVTVAFAWKAQTSTFLHDTRVAAESTEDAAKIVKQASMPTNATAKKMTSTAVKNTTGELFRMQEEIEQLRKQLHKCNKAGSDASVMQMDEELRELQDMLRSLESAEVETGTSSPGANHDQLKVEIEHLRGAIGRLQRFGGVTVELPTATEAPLESAHDVAAAIARAVVRAFLVSVTVAFAWKAQTSPSQHETRVAAESAKDAASIVKQAPMPTNTTAKNWTSTAAKNATGELFRMQDEIEQLRQQLHRCNKGGSDSSVVQMDEELRELQDMLRSLQSAEVETGYVSPGTNHDKLKIEIEHLRGAIGRLQRFGGLTVEFPTATEAPLENGTLRYRIKGGHAATRTRGFDVDTEMPYGELEPFGREDTAQELTEASIRESDRMVDQVERAEVAEEKRAVFRALTRLRGAAITSFDGVARSQTGNIDEYNKVHQWRATHPLSHLADEESDVSKWAFPDNAD